MKKVFIDGSAGTTGLRIRDRLAQRDDIKLIELPEEKRKDTPARRKALNSADISFLCLPDAAAIEAVELVENEKTVILDTSTAHRTAPGWAYGFPELSAEFEAKIISSKRIAVPGCHASGFIALVYPLIEAGLLGKDALLSCTSLTGYSGGGKKMIAEYEGYEKGAPLFAPRQYGTSQQHKHLKEMKAVCGIDEFPIFCPIVDDYYSGMEVTVPIFARLRREIQRPRRDLRRRIAGRLSLGFGALRHGRHEDMRLRQRGADIAHGDIRQPRQGRFGRGSRMHESGARQREKLRIEY